MHGKVRKAMHNDSVDAVAVLITSGLKHQLSLSVVTAESLHK
jgi:hypothetical protein